MSDCSFCGTTFSTKTNLKKHLCKANACENLLGETKTRGQLVYELSRHVIDPKHCKFCNKPYSHSCSMYTHQKTCIYNPANIQNATDMIEPTLNLITGSTNPSIDQLHNVEMRDSGCFHIVLSKIINLVKCW